MIINTNWTNDEYNETIAKLQYIVQQICKRNSKTKKWIAPRFEDIVWIIALTNYKICQKYCLSCINLDIFNFIEDGYNFTPNEFNFKRKDLLELISEAEQKELDNVCLQWKIYGKIGITIKQYFKKLFN